MLPEYCGTLLNQFVTLNVSFIAGCSCCPSTAAPYWISSSCPAYPLSQVVRVAPVQRHVTGSVRHAQHILYHRLFVLPQYCGTLLDQFVMPSISFITGCSCCPSIAARYWISSSCPAYPLSQVVRVAPVLRHVIRSVRHAQHILYHRLFVLPQYCGTLLDQFVMPSISFITGCSCCPSIAARYWISSSCSTYPLSQVVRVASVLRNVVGTVPHAQPSSERTRMSHEAVEDEERLVVR